MFNTTTTTIDIQRFLEKRHFTFPDRGKWRRSNEHSSLVINVESGFFEWHSRGVKGFAYHWLTEIENLSPSEAAAELRGDNAAYRPYVTPAPKLKPNAGPEPWKLQALPSRAAYYHQHRDNPAATAEFFKRGLNPATVEHFQLGYCQQKQIAWSPARYAETVTIPYFDVNGDVVNIRHRILNAPNGDKYRPEFGGLGNQLFNIHDPRPPHRFMDQNAVLLVEGEFKTIRVWQEGLSAVGLPGLTSFTATMAAQIKSRGFDVLYHVPDPEPAPKPDEPAERYQRRLIDYYRTLDRTEATARAEGLSVYRVALPGKIDDLLTAGTITGDDVWRKCQDSRLSPTALEAKNKALAEAAARRAERQARFAPAYNDNEIPFLIPDAETYRDVVIPHRRAVSKADEWRLTVEMDYPELDVKTEYERKVAENYEERVALCGKPMPKVTPTGDVVIRHMQCGVCEKCQKLKQQKLVRAVEKLVYGLNPRPLGIVTTDDATRATVTRRFRDWRISYKCYPVNTPTGVQFDVVYDLDAVRDCRMRTKPAPDKVLDQDTDPAMFAAYAAKWLDPTPKEGKRSSGNLLPNRDDLMRTDKLLEFEVAHPYLLDTNGDILPGPDGRPTLRPDIVAIELTGYVTDTDKPPEPPPVDEVYDLDSLQRGIHAASDGMRERLLKQKHVIYRVVSKTFLTTLNDLPLIIERFNETQRRRKAAKQPKRQPQTTVAALPTDDLQRRLRELAAQLE